MLTNTEAKQFLVEILEINNVEEILNNNKFDTIEAIIDVYREKQPFQNITLMSMALEERHRPSWDEIKEAMYLKQGGLCYSHHVFLFALFQALDFDVSLCVGRVNRPNDHVVLVFRDIVIEGDIYLLEAAVGLPSFHLISLDFKEESPVYNDSYLEYKYIKHGGKVLRMHRKGDLRPVFVKERDVNIDGWTRFYDFELRETKNIDDLAEDFDAVYTDPKVTRFHDHCYFIIFKNRKAFIVRNKTLLSENGENQLDKKQSEKDQEIIQFVCNLSSLDESTISRAIKNSKEENRPLTLE